MADDQKALKKRLKMVMSLPHNQICSDCNERQPRWASLIVPPPGVYDGAATNGNLAIGALCCLECSGSHRRLGVHISFVRSINLDSCTYYRSNRPLTFSFWSTFLLCPPARHWVSRELLSLTGVFCCFLLWYWIGKEKEVLAMEHGGNAKVNAIFEARLPANSSIKPTNHADGPTRERFIRDKYERRKYYDASAASFHSNDGNNNNNSSSSNNGHGATSSSEASSVGPPSDAAKQRLEQRRARINKGLNTSGSASFAATATSSSGTSNPSKSRPKVAKAPASAPPPQNMVDLLGFDTPVAESSAPTSAKANAAEFDLFDFSSTAGTSNTSNGTSTNNYNNSSSINDQWNQLTSQASQPQQQAAKPSIDLASLYNGGQQQQQPMGFANFGPGGNVGYASNNNSNPMMMNGGGMMHHNNNPMQQMNMAMQNMNFSNQHMTPQQMAYQQQQMMMMQQQQQQQMMLQQQQQQMMMQQQQQQFPNTSMNHFGTTPNPTPTKVTTSKVAAIPEKDDPFAQFGTNMFR